MMERAKNYKHLNCTCGNAGYGSECRLLARTYCVGCGWDRSEVRRRKALIREYGLTEIRPGIRGLVIRHE